MKKQSSYEPSDEVYVGSARYPYQAIPAAFVKQIDKQLKENLE
jgi:hypothetical protein